MTPLSYALEDDRIAPVLYALFVSVFDTAFIRLLNITRLSTTGWINKALTLQIRSKGN